MPPTALARHAAALSAVALSAAAALLPAVGSAQDAPQRLPTVQLNAGIHNIRAEVARTPQQRATGLMHRTALPANDGMLFVFEQAGTQCFWMKNTLLPLSIAFVADDGTIVNVAEMQAGSLDSTCSAQPVRHALEMNRGWFDKRGLKTGSRLRGGPFAR